MNAQPLDPETIRLRQRLLRLRHHIDAAEIICQQIGRADEGRERLIPVRELAEERWAEK